jgi:N6-L-threonylcarbamoyladenine synthase
LGESYDFSFSGLKTALLRIVEPYRLPSAPAAPRPAGQFAEHRPPVYRDDLPASDLAAAYQEAVVDVLATKAVRAAHEFGAKTLLLAGGVAANAALRQRISAEIVAAMGSEAIPVSYPPIILCTDNAAMVAGAAFFAIRRGAQAGWETDIQPRLPLVPDQGVTFGGMG